MALDDLIFSAGIFAAICAVALTTVLVADRLPAPKEEPSCRWIATEVIPAGFAMFRGEVKVWRDPYEVDVLQCEGGIITVRR